MHPHLEYTSVIWSPYQRKYINSIEGVQHRFLRFASFRLSSPMSRLDHDCLHIMQRLNLLTLEVRRLVADAAILFNIINGNINCPCLLSLFDFNACPRPLRTFPLFRPNVYRSNLSQTDTITRIYNFACQSLKLCDLFSCSAAIFNRAVRRALL